MKLPFTECADRALKAAPEEARRLDHYYVGGAHLLLGLVHEREGVAAKTLSGFGLSLETARREVEEVMGRGPAEPDTPFPHTPRSARILAHSEQTAFELGHDHIGTGHLLLGVLAEQEGQVSQVVNRHVSDREALRQQVLDHLTDLTAET